jgi:SOS response regulatory protein OraA/RecX
VNEIYHQALRLLRRRDYTVQQLRHRLESKFGVSPEEVLSELLRRGFLDDSRFAENFVAKHGKTHPSLLRTRLEEAGVASQYIDSALANAACPSIRNAVDAKMAVWHLSPPLQMKEVSRLFRALSRLGYPEDEIREELEHLNE